MAEKRKYLDEQGLKVLAKANKDLFVQKESNKGLSDENYTKSEKEKLASLQAYSVATSTENGLMSTADKNKIDKVADGAEVNQINVIKKNGVIVTTEDKTVDITVPVSVSDLVNDKGFMNKEDFDNATKEALAKLTNFKTSVVDSLPQVENAEENTLYLVKDSDKAGNIYKEYLKINGKYELIGDTSVDIDLSEYAKLSDIESITDEEIRQIINA